jgi:hypothetical protein
MHPPEPLSPPLFRPSYTPEFTNAEDAAAYVHTLIAERRTLEYGGALYKYGERFIATVPVGGSAFGFDTAVIHPVDATGLWREPSRFTLVGFYHSHPALAHNPPSINFFSDHDIYSAITLNEHTPGVALYLSNPDGSLLKFTPTNTDLTKALLPRITPDKTNKGTSPLHQDMLAGTVNWLSYVQQVAAAGCLHVIRASTLWRHLGDVSPKWQPTHEDYDLITPERLGPSFLTSQDALNWLQQHLPHSTTHALSAGLLLTRTNDQLVVPTYPLPLNDVGFSIESLLPLDDSGIVALPADHSISACYFAPLSNLPGSSLQTLNGERRFVSPELIFALLSKLRLHPGLSAYFYTQEATLFHYTSLDSPEENHLLEALTPFGGKRCQVHRALAIGDLSAEAFIRQVAAAGELRVVHAQGSWPSSGQVPADWSPATPALKGARPSAGVMRQVCSNPDDAVAAFTHELEAYDQAIIGVVLQNPQTGNCVTSAQLAAGTLNYRYINLFAPKAARRPVLPQGYVPRGVFFHPQPLGAHASTAAYPNAGTFFHPQALQFFFQLRSYGLPISDAYWTSTDGALLKYTSRNSVEELVFLGDLFPDSTGGISYAENQLTTAGLSLDEFIATWAEAGELTVLRTDRHWPQRGVYVAAAPATEQHSDG